MSAVSSRRPARGPRGVGRGLFVDNGFVADHQRLRAVIAKERSLDLDVLRGYIEAGDVTPAVHRTYALAEVPDAIRYMRSGAVRGKVVITVRSA